MTDGRQHILPLRASDLGPRTSDLGLGTQHRGLGLGPLAGPPTLSRIVIGGRGRINEEALQAGTGKGRGVGAARIVASRASAKAEHCSALLVAGLKTRRCVPAALTRELPLQAVTLSGNSRPHGVSGPLVGPPTLSRIAIGGQGREDKGTLFTVRSPGSEVRSRKGSGKSIVDSSTPWSRDVMRISGICPLSTMRVGRRLSWWYTREKIVC